MVVGGFAVAAVPATAGPQPDYMENNNKDNMGKKMQCNNNTTGFISPILLEQLQKEIFDAITCTIDSHHEEMKVHLQNLRESLNPPTVKDTASTDEQLPSWVEHLAARADATFCHSLAEFHLASDAAMARVYCIEHHNDNNSCKQSDTDAKNSLPFELAMANLMFALTPDANPVDCCFARNLQRCFPADFQAPREVLLRPWNFFSDTRDGTQLISPLVLDAAPDRTENTTNTMASDMSSNMSSNMSKNTLQPAEHHNKRQAEQQEARCEEHHDEHQDEQQDEQHKS